MKNTLGVIFWSGLFLLLTPLTVSASVVCTNLTNDLSYGATDSYSGGSVTMLQNFLSAEGYFTPTPNGHFGPATLAAVVSFQAGHAIPSTGYVGSLTRSAITTASCSTNSVSTTNSSAPVTTPATVVSSSNGIVTAPLAGTSLPIGQTYTITWNGVNKAGYTITLEDQTGLSYGFITPNTQTAGSFIWQVGTVLSAVTDAYSTVNSGTYRIHMESLSSAAPDIYSGYFNITVPALSISSVIPLIVSLSGSQTMALYGSGFSQSSRISVDGYYNSSSNPFYASPDGTIIVFPLPSDVPIGTHVVDVSNIYGSLATSPAFTITQ